MRELILASSNAHKAHEFELLLANALKVAAAPRALEVDESGSTYLENSLIKARTYHEVFKLPAMADDSGLTIEALPDILGVHSARFFPERPSYKDKCQEILKRMEGVPEEKRTALFTCVLCFYFSAEEVFFFEGRVHGKIATTYRGEGGFGYDPIFVPLRDENDGQTLAELTDWKNRHSHRAKAVEGALKFFIT